MTLPGRGPQSQEERQANAVRSQPTRSADGLILTRGQGQPAGIQPQRQHGIPAGGTAGQTLAKSSDDDYDVDWAAGGGAGIIAFAKYDDDSIPTSATTYVIDPATLNDSEGDAASYFAYAGGTPGVQMTALGWYQVFVRIQVTGLTVGDVVHIRIHWPTAGYDTDSYGIADALGASLSVTSLPQKNYDTTGVIKATVWNPAGGSINTAQVFVLAVSGP